jgi:hypothetical protein
VERDRQDGLRPVAVFGPVPQRIPPGVPYRVWTYRNVQGTTWLLYFAMQPFGQAGAQDGPPQVVEVGSYPEGAVF